MSDSVTLEDHPHRYEISADDQPAGFAQFKDVGDERIFFHTEIGEQFGGRGLGGTLVSAALESTVADGKKIVPLCPFVKGYVEKHPEWNEHVVAPTEAHIAALQG